MAMNFFFTFLVLCIPCWWIASMATKVTKTTMHDYSDLADVFFSLFLIFAAASIGCAIWWIWS